MILVESPAKAKKIQDFLGPAYKVMLSFMPARNLYDDGTNPQLHAASQGVQVLSR